MIISLRGTNGSAKSTVIRAFLERVTSRRPIYGALGPRRPEAYELNVPGCRSMVYLLGPYQVPSGGCDQMTYDQVLFLLEKYAHMGDVIFEGIIVTSVYGRVGEFMEKFGKDSVFVFLDTPLETCLQRVEKRRGKLRDDRLVHNVTAKFNTVTRIREKVITERKMRSYTTSSEKAAGLIVKILKGDPKADLPCDYCLATKTHSQTCARLR